jgi:hypothetical protein
MQTSGLKRDIIDKFYTKTIVSKECCELIKQFINIHNENDIIIEPSAGNGSFIPEICNMSSNYLFYDIQPEHSDIIKQDYLCFDIQSIELPDLYSKIHIIGNPPFGRQSSLAIKFIKKSTEFCDTISFILPKSFKKDSMQKHFPLRFHLVYQCDLDDKSFIINDVEEKDVPCVFQIWEKRNYDREQIVKQISTRFKFVKIDESPDISFRRVGVNAGKIDTKNLSDKSIQSHYFIRFDDDVDTQTLIEKISTIVYDTNNTVGPKSISKQEIIKEFNKLFAD